MACPLGIRLAGKPDNTVQDCTKKLLVAHDIMDVLNGKWKMEVMLILLQVEKRRFRELQLDLAGVSAKVLSAVLKDLEINQIVFHIADAGSDTAYYQLTEYGRSLKQALADFVKLGIAHRHRIMGNNTEDGDSMF